MSEQPDIERLNELHAHEDDTRWVDAIRNAWPALYRELTEARKRLATLEEFARRVRSANERLLDESKSELLESAIQWLDAETTKAGE